MRLWAASPFRSLRPANSHSAPRAAAQMGNRHRPPDGDVHASPRPGTLRQNGSAASSTRRSSPAPLQVTLRRITLRHGQLSGLALRGPACGERTPLGQPPPERDVHVIRLLASVRSLAGLPQPPASRPHPPPHNGRVRTYLESPNHFGCGHHIYPWFRWNDFV